MKNKVKISWQLMQKLNSKIDLDHFQLIKKNCLLDKKIDLNMKNYMQTPILI